MFSIGNNELKKKEALGDTVTCNRCGESHPVEYGDEVLPDGTRKPSKLLAFYKCGEKSYLAGVNGKKL